MAHAASFFLSDGVILTGQATGLPANADEIQKVKNSMKLPVLVGSGVTVDNLKEYLDADALIVGSHFKKEGRWFNKVEKDRVTHFMERIVELRKKK